MTNTRTELRPAIAAAEAYAGSTGVGCVVLDRQGGVHHPEAPEHYPCRLCRLVSGDSLDAESVASAQWRWVTQALRFGGQYVFLCDNAFTHWTTPILDGGRIVGALVAGPVLTIDDEHFFENEIVPRAADRNDAATLRTLFDEVPHLAPSRVTALANLLTIVGRSLSRDDEGKLQSAADQLEVQSRIGEFVHDLKQQRVETGRDPEVPSYPVVTERRLLDSIRRGDVSGAQRTLNELLGHVFFAAGSDLPSIRYRTRELVVLLSRAAIGEGADPEEIFGLNYQFVDTLEDQDDVNQVAYWMSRIVRRFAELVLYLPNVTHARALRKAISHVRHNLGRPIRVAEVAAEVGLSPSYFSRLFHREMNETFVEYLNRARVERAKDLLRSTNLAVTAIAGEVGFADHSYFTKVFRREVGSTPSSYRAS